MGNGVNHRAQLIKCALVAFGLVAAACSSTDIESAVENGSSTTEAIGSSSSSTTTNAPATTTSTSTTTVSTTTSTPPTTSTTIDEGGSEVVERGDLAWETAAQMAFLPGLDRESLEDRWDGYPYAVEERSDRIDTFLEDFAWTQDERTLVELNQFFAFGERSDFFEPIITIHSEPERDRAAAFVATWDGEVFGLGRLPELDEGLTVVSADEQSVTLDGVGTEGGPAAFYFGQPLEITADHETLTTTVMLPADYVSGDPITVVFPTPELAAASILRLQ